ncbi:hypothetical protein [Filimonas lacunae]|uniref:hypothetical protein n=1 Tax=Filimonas lacunae TaxID=477680 RepID=UPI0007D71FD9|nr:hypothetical protein [Filimonas lacunae]BAV04352.1 hypothetical protein FLA_0340 [Filimonas lacunae]
MKLTKIFTIALHITSVVLLTMITQTGGFMYLAALCSGKLSATHPLMNVSQ